MRKRPTAERIGDDYGWLLAQFLLLGATFVAGPLGEVLGLRVDLPLARLSGAIAGVAAIIGGLIVAAQGRADLGDSLRVAPSPLDDAELVERGWYGRVRHPLYLAVLLVVLGWTLIWLSYLSIAMLLLVGLFFRVKAAHEERLLLEMYPDYRGYMDRVRARFVPRVW